jgi:hypothetical protein
MANKTQSITTNQSQPEKIEKPKADQGLLIVFILGCISLWIFLKTKNRKNRKTIIEQEGLTLSYTSDNGAISLDSNKQCLLVKTGSKYTIYKKSDLRGAAQIEKEIELKTNDLDRPLVKISLKTTREAEIWLQRIGIAFDFSSY